MTNPQKEIEILQELYGYLKTVSECTTGSYNSALSACTPEQKLATEYWWKDQNFKKPIKTTVLIQFKQIKRNLNAHTDDNPLKSMVFEAFLRR